MTHDPQNFEGVADASRALSPFNLPDGQVVGTPRDEGQIRRFWETSLNQRGIEPQRSSAVVPVRVDHGRWLADCPRRGCKDAALALLGCREACCLGCGTYFAVAWPGDEEMKLAVAALSLRPVAARNWTPDVEPAGSLVAENISYGHPAPRYH